MNRTLWIHQFDQWFTVTGNKPIAPVIKGQGFTRVAVKALDGANWMNQYDKSADAIGSIADLVSWEEAFERRELGMDVWVAPHKESARGTEPLYLAILAAIKGRLIFDMEPYAELWGDQSNVDTFFSELFGTIQNQSGFATTGGLASRLGLSYDPRRTDWLQTWYNRFPVIMPQMYDKAWLNLVVPLGKPAEVLVSTSQSYEDWRTILSDPVAWSQDGRTGYGVFRGPLTNPGQVGAVLDGLT